MGLILLFVAGLVGYAAFYRAPDAGGAPQLPPKEADTTQPSKDLDLSPPALDMSLDAQFDRALLDLRKDPITHAAFRVLTAMGGGPSAPAPTDAQVNALLDEAEAENRQHWGDKEPHLLAEDAVTTRQIGAQLLLAAAAKDKSTVNPMMLEVIKAGDVIAFELKTRRLSDLQQQKIESITKQGKNLDAAFDAIDVGGEPSLDTQTDVNLIDKAALSPLLFQYASVEFDPYTKQASGIFIQTSDGAPVGEGLVEIDRPVGQIDTGSISQMVHIGKVVSFIEDDGAPLPPLGSYFAPGTNIYASRPLATV